MELREFCSDLYWFWVFFCACLLAVDVFNSSDFWVGVWFSSLFSGCVLYVLMDLLDSYCFVFSLRADSRHEETRQFFATITSCPPSSGRCNACEHVRKDNSSLRCMEHSFAVHFKYDTIPPHPPIIQSTTVSIPNVFVVNTGTSLEVLDVALKAFLPYSATGSSSTEQRPITGQHQLDTWSHDASGFSDGVFDERVDLPDDVVHLSASNSCHLSKTALAVDSLISCSSASHGGSSNQCHSLQSDCSQGRPYPCQVHGAVAPSPSQSRSNMDSRKEDSRLCCVSQHSPSLFSTGQPVTSICRCYTNSPQRFALAESQGWWCLHSVYEKLAYENWVYLFHNLPLLS